MRLGITCTGAALTSSLISTGCQSALVDDHYLFQSSQTLLEALVLITILVTLPAIP
jgi:hypothetical protein